jgi:hypothetical protein
MPLRISRQIHKARIILLSILITSKNSFPFPRPHRPSFLPSPAPQSFPLPSPPADEAVHPIAPYRFALPPPKARAWPPRLLTGHGAAVARPFQASRRPEDWPAVREVQGCSSLFTPAGSPGMTSDPEQGRDGHGGMGGARQGCRQEHSLQPFVSGLQRSVVLFDLFLSVIRH